ncbi:uncharacterized protein LOC121733311 [Aricia agestis]|uniref:uncharacterized protein LOC121733311 n=1 Tax=Aricia agestis TaxID=91739 RepID=UPI001C206CB5|nr:uncharacterized protein LOC121733311 [Aricia agestis]
MRSLLIDTSIVTACVFGILVSTYGFYVSMKLESNPSYRALCDLSENFSCSKVLTSRYSKGLVFLNTEYLMVPNTVYGILVYCALILLSNFEQWAALKFQLLLAFGSFATCFYLPICILCILKQFCVVSFTLYAIKMIIFALVLQKYKIRRNKLKSSSCRLGGNSCDKEAFIRSKTQTMLRRVNRSIISTCIFGVLVSTYALYVEMAVEAKPGYKAMCDFAPHASCTKVLSSPYAKGLGLVPEDSSWKLPNCLYGILFYCFYIFLSTFDDPRVVRFQQALSLVSLALCVYLAYILVFILKDFCIVCVTTYMINIFLTILFAKKYKLLCTKAK